MAGPATVESVSRALIATGESDQEKDVMSTPRCPEWWPLPDGSTIGDDRANELVAFIRDRATPIIDIAKSYLQTRHPGQDIKVRGSRATAIAKLSLAPHMTGIPIGTVTAGAGGNAHIVRIGLDRAGHITAHLSNPSEPVMRSVSL